MEDNIEDLKEGFIELGAKFKFETEDINFCFIPAIEKNKVCNDNIDNCKNNAANCELDCMNSRLLTSQVCTIVLCLSMITEAAQVHLWVILAANVILKPKNASSVLNTASVFTATIGYKNRAKRSRSENF